MTNRRIDRGYVLAPADGGGPSVIARIGDDGTILSQNGGIDHVNHLGTGQYQIFFTEGLFTESPCCQANTEQASDNGYYANVRQALPESVIVQTYLAGDFTNRFFNLVCYSLDDA